MATRIRDLEGVGARKDYYYVDPRIIQVRDGWNPRTDFTGEEELRDSIIENGVLMPLRVRRDQDDNITLIDGERRLRATLRAIAEGHDIQTVPCMFERNGIGDVEAMLLTLISNEGKPLDPIEEAAAFRKLQGWGLTLVDIAKRIGKSQELVRQRLELVDASPEVQTAIRENQIGLTQAREIVKQSGGSVEAQRQALAMAPRKSERRPPKPPVDLIMEKVVKLTREELEDLYCRLDRMMVQDGQSALAEAANG